MTAVIFDLDGVLIDSEKLQYKAYALVLERFGVTVTVAEYSAHWIAAGHGPEYAVHTYALPVTADALRALKHPVYHDILRTEVVLMPGVIEALTRLQPHGPLALATNSNRQDVAFVMERFDLARFFATVVAREDYSKAKPQPDAFVAAAARLDQPATRCVVVEDSYRGVLAARRAGAPAIAVPNVFTRTNDFSLAARVLRSLDELTVDVVESVVGK